MTLTIEQVKELCPKVEGRVTLIKLESEATTLGEDIRAIVPFIEAGFKYVAFDDYHYSTVLSDTPITLKRQDFKHLLKQAPPVEGEISDGTKIVLYYMTICNEDDE